MERVFDGLQKIEELFFQAALLNIKELDIYLFITCLALINLATTINILIFDLVHITQPYFLGRSEVISL